MYTHHKGDDARVTEIREVETFLKLVITKRARHLKLPWAESPAALARNLHNCVRTFWATFPAATLVIDMGELRIRPGRHDHDASMNPLSSFLLTNPGGDMLPRFAG